jgi:hypothetical protein
LTCNWSPASRKDRGSERATNWTCQQLATVAKADLKADLKAEEKPSKKAGGKLGGCLGISWV